MKYKIVMLSNFLVEAENAAQAYNLFKKNLKKKGRSYHGYHLKNNRKVYTGAIEEIDGVKIVSIERK